MHARGSKFNQEAKEKTLNSKAREKHKIVEKRIITQQQVRKLLLSNILKDDKGKVKSTTAQKKR